MAGRYPPLEPYEHGMLDAGDGQQVYWETCGNPNGKPAVVLHGGPGSGAPPPWRQYFDPDRYRIVVFDQRGCGRSRPSVSDPGTDLAANTTQHLIGDIELLRQRLDIERWLVFGGSWGSTLGLAYAQRHRERVSEIVLFGIGTTRRSEVEWITRDVGRLFPAEWARFRAGVPVADRDGDLVAAYRRLLHDPDPAVRERAARDWCTWEDAHVRIHADQPSDPRYAVAEFRMTFARLVTHYWHHLAFLEDGSLLRDAPRLAGIPGVLVHGRLDVSSPLETAWLLSNAWPDAELVVIDEAGHGGDQRMIAALVTATDRFAVVP